MTQFTTKDISTGRHQRPCGAEFVPRQALARALAIGIGISALFLTGLIAAIAVDAMHAALTGSDAS